MRDVEICVLGVFSPPPHTASPTPSTHSRLKYVPEHGVLGLHVGLVVRAEAGVVEGVLRVDLRTRDRGLQTEKCLSILKDAPTKRALKSLYRGKKPLTLSQEPSAFMGEPTVDMSLRSRGEGLRATWTTQKWPQP